MWINQVEGRFALLTQKQLLRGVHRSGRELVPDIIGFIETPNVDSKPFAWSNTAGEIIASLERLCCHTLNAHVPEISARASGARH